MKCIMEEVIERLMISGLSEVDAEMLVAAFLEENAEEYSFVKGIAEVFDL